MKLRLIKITEEEWNKYRFSDATYIINGCIFWKANDNIIAFSRQEHPLKMDLDYFRIEVKE